MKRDRIEDRLAEIEREIKSFKSEHRQDMENMRDELKRFQEIMIEDRIREIRSELASGFGEIAIKGAMDRSDRSLDEKLVNPCPRDMRDKCKGIFVSHLDTAVARMDGRDLDEAVAEVVRCDGRDFARLKVEPCNHCYDVYQTERDSVIAVAQKLIKYREGLMIQKNGLYLADLPDDAVISNIVDPLSHEARFRMLKSLSAGSLSYTDLAGITGYEGGHLIYHLNKLVSSGLVIKSDGGRYTITKKGMGVMEIVRKMFCE